ncbi:hypothetical protein CU669_10945 [Paramagnetospirillum kuznetsovii]|uniref:Uncharacterized protein n=1 Tax=Paramagnetospirillum kuznetsovii TaxID=2053833 RepID=A0A364NXN0_9PROT|nr:hypothetical protein [Paramagnetospirillum kuznetsovii]RAU21816.1 hypothetical protein CU669_10945 [Paramagnetospirillum kuznetsovii]
MPMYLRRIRDVAAAFSAPSVQCWIQVACLALILVGGLAHLAPDANESYLLAAKFEWYRHDVDGRRSIELPWWVRSFKTGERLLVPVAMPPVVPKGQWFVDILANESGCENVGHVIVGEAVQSLRKTPYAAWQRIELPPPLPGPVTLELSYRPACPDGHLSVWGVFDDPPSADRALMESGGRRMLLDRLLPVPFRSTPVPFVGLVELDFIEHMDDVAGKVPAVRYGVRAQAIGRHEISLWAMWFGAAGSLAHLAALAVGFWLREPAWATALFGAFATTVAVRLDAVARVRVDIRWRAGIDGLREVISQDLPRPSQILNGDGIFADAAQYFAHAVSIYANQENLLFDTPYGLSMMSAALFPLTGISPIPVVMLNILIQAATGLLIYYLCFRISGRKWLSFLPLVYWMVFDRPFKYALMYLTEAPATALLLAGLAIILARPGASPSVPTRYAELPFLLLAGALLSMATYTRDIVVVLIPACVVITAIVYGWKPRSLGFAGLVLMGVVIWWLPLPMIFPGKTFSPMGFTPVALTRIGQASTLMVGEGGESTVTGLIGNAMVSFLRPLADDPLGGLYRMIAGFWWPNWGGDTEAAFHHASPFILPIYNLLEWPLLIGAFLLMWHRDGLALIRIRWWCLVALLAYVTTFHIVLWSAVQPRNKEIYYPEVIILAFLGLTAAVEWVRGWGAVWRQRIASETPPPAAGGATSRTDR